MTGSPNKHFLTPTFHILTHLSQNSRERDTERGLKNTQFLKRVKLSALRKWKLLLLVTSQAPTGSCFPAAPPGMGGDCPDRGGRQDSVQGGRRRAALGLQPPGTWGARGRPAPGTRAPGGPPARAASSPVARARPVPAVEAPVWVEPSVSRGAPHGGRLQCRLGGQRGERAPPWGLTATALLPTVDRHGQAPRKTSRSDSPWPQGTHGAVTG